MRKFSNPKLLPKGPVPVARVLWAAPIIIAKPVLSNNAARGQPQDLEYFQYFQEQTILELCGGFEEPLWDRYLLQACQEAPFVRHIALSLAALGRAERTTLARESEQHEAYALHKYSSSLPEIRKYLAGTKNPDPRMFLVTGLLIFLFEFQQGNRMMATKQLRTTLALFKNMRKIRSEKYTHVHRLNYPDTFEEAIVEMVVRLENHITLDLVDQTARIKGNGSSALGIVHVHHAWPVIFPTEFSTVFEAQRLHNYIQYWGSPNFPSDASRCISAYSQLALGKACDIPKPRIVSFCEYSRGLRELTSWRRSFLPLLAKLRAGKSSELACALIIYIQSLCFTMVIKRRLGWVLDDSVPSPGVVVEEYDESVDDVCRTMVDAGRELCVDKHFMRCFTFDPGVLPTLLLVMFGTEDLDIRFEITEILRDMIPRKESVWDSVDVSKLADVLYSHGSSLRIP
ncbi:hypothetical protein VTL71DRAFT_3700 [Oculimacula yallundae]|uniref:Uncharacterized protein n=1 Tax=Oculimacula yallundae TaxID=86028 RepID=A0ABR4C3V2_9HELO